MDKVEEYKGPRPGCYKCKQPILDEDYYTLIWRGKTWEMVANYHLNCLIDAFVEGEIKKLPCEIIEPELKVGQTLTIFEDPISQLKSEGKATLVKFEAKDNDGIYNMERWLVRFQGQSETFSRKIMPQDTRYKRG